MNYFVIGTAGHVDHGKTALIKALTGIDCDRLKEEKQRGMTIDIGFAYFNLLNGDCVEIIDVPGHERFIKNMLCGAGTIDMVLFIIAADEGIMAQTKEHLDILNLLGIERGVVVVTKVDLIQKEWLNLVKEEISQFIQGTFLENAPLICTSTKTLEGIEELKQSIEHICLQAKPKEKTSAFRLPIDRVFSIEGFGTIITGTIVSGTIKKGDEVEVFPQRLSAKVRQIESHKQSIDMAVAGQRVGLNLVGVKKEKLLRGDVLAYPGCLSCTGLFDGQLKLLRSCPRPFKNASRIRLHLGTGEFLARAILLDQDELLPPQEALVQFQLDKNIACFKSDRFVVRFYSPMRTIGGGQIIDPRPTRHKRFDEKVILRLIDLQRMTALQLRERIFDERLLDLKRDILNILGDFHRTYSLRLNMPKEEIRSKLSSKKSSEELFLQALAELCKEKQVCLENDQVRLAGHRLEFSPEREKLKLEIEELLINKRFVTLDLKDLTACLKAKPEEIKQMHFYLINTGRVVKLSTGLLFHQQAVQEARGLLKDYLKSKNEGIAVSEFCKLLNTSRKYGLPLLQYFDEIRFTKRVGDKRVLA